MKYLLMPLCAIFYACDTGTNAVNEPDNLLNNTVTELSSSSLENSSTSALSSSSSSELLDGRLDGSCLNPPTAENVYFNAEGGTDNVIIVGGANLLFGRDDGACKYIRGDHYIIDENRMRQLIKAEDNYCENNYCYSNPSVYAYAASYSAPVTKIECSWFSVAHTSLNTLSVSVNKNETGEERSAGIGLFAGDCGDVGFTIFQSAENAPSSSSIVDLNSSSSNSPIYGCGGPIPVQPLLNSNGVSFGKLGGIDNVTVGGVSRLIGNSDTEECEYTNSDYNISIIENGVQTVQEVRGDYCKSNYCRDIVSISNPLSIPIMKKECSWYSVTITSVNSFLISVNENETGEERSVYVPYYRTGCDLVEGGFTITQSAE